MSETIYLSVVTMCVQLGSVYLLYLPFSRDVTAQQLAELRRKYFPLSAAVFVMNLFFFADGASFFAFKMTLLTGWIPYLLLSMTVIRDKAAQHAFASGMIGLWAFMLHAGAGMVVTVLYGAMTEEFLPLQLTIYLVLFAALLKVERQFFTNLLPTQKFFEDTSLKWYISLLPLAIFIGLMIPIFEFTFLPTWKEKFSRAFFPIFFFLMYRSMSLATHQVAERQRQEQRTRLLNRQMESLNEHNALIEKRRREVAALRADLNENYSVLDDLLAAGKVSEATAYVRRQANLLDATRVQVFSHAPLINAALSIYLKRAREVGISLRHKIDLPATFSTDESDLAVLLSNLLENAITASKRQPPGARELSIIIRNVGGQYVLEIENRYDFPIKIGANGLPYTSEIGHGLGMSSLESFAKKYDAFVDFEHTGGRVHKGVVNQNEIIFLHELDIIHVDDDSVVALKKTFVLQQMSAMSA